MSRWLMNNEERQLEYDMLTIEAYRETLDTTKDPSVAALLYSQIGIIERYWNEQTQPWTQAN